MPQGACKVRGCNRPCWSNKARLCNKHYLRWSRTGSTELKPRKKIPRYCDIKRCSRTHYARGWCNMHWNRWRTTGTTDLVDPIAPLLAEGKKPCTKCLKVKPLEDFYKGEGKSGRHLWCKKCVKANVRAWELSNPEKVSKHKKDYWGRDRERNAEKNRLTQLRLRQEALHILGDKCAHCDIDDVRCLQIDHMYGDGALERKTGVSSYTRYKKIIAGSTNYQILCANCNWIKRYENQETRPRTVNF